MIKRKCSLDRTFSPPLPPKVHCEHVKWPEFPAGISSNSWLEGLNLKKKNVELSLKKMERLMHWWKLKWNSMFYANTWFNITESKMRKSEGFSKECAV